MLTSTTSMECNRWDGSERTARCEIDIKERLKEKLGVDFGNYLIPLRLIILESGLSSSVRPASLSMRLRSSSRRSLRKPPLIET